MTRRRAAIRICYDPAECVPSCEDPQCPYSHFEAWSLWRGAEYLTGPFDSEKDAKAEAEAIERGPK